MHHRREVVYFLQLHGAANQRHELLPLRLVTAPGNMHDRNDAKSFFVLF